MKNLVLLVFLFVSMKVAAQSFEGTMQWSATQNPSGPGGGSPTGLTIKAKGTSLITTINGGMMNGSEMWYLDKGAKTMRVMRPQKMFVVVPPEAIASAEKSFEAGKFVRSNETTKVLTYTCTKYSGEIKSMGVTTKVIFWTTNELKDDQNVLARQPDPFGNPKLPAGVEGIPLKIEKIAPNGTTSVLEVTEVKLEKLGDDIFKLPADFKEMGK